MQRDQRVRDNAALNFAAARARANAADFTVVFSLVPGFPGANLRHYDFMIRGLREVERDLRRLGIPFVLLEGGASDTLPAFVRDRGVGMLVTDFNPIRAVLEWKRKLRERLEIPFFEVDAHNVVPAWIFGKKREFAARTLRPKIRAALPRFLEEDAFPDVPPQPLPPPVDWDGVRSRLRVDASVLPTERFVPGESAAHATLAEFLDRKISDYDRLRNEPDSDGQSNLSPYLHFGQISAKRCVLETLRRENASAYAPDAALSPGAEAFLEELVVRRELAENFCLTTERYDSFDAFPAWAKATLDAHRGDPRIYRYDRTQFENARTHDPIWNAAQREMAVSGKMHGYLRMYWAKKILEWSASPEEALETAILLNDRYSLDGRDPNGYAGIAWSIGGLHDRPWFDRPIFGTVRYMAESGVRKRGDIDAYVAKWGGMRG